MEIKHPDQIQLEGESAIMTHPFSIMEHEKDGKRYYDFMFFTMHQSTDRKQMTAFLEKYARHNGNARYLLECDVSDPLFNGEFNDPKDFLKNGREHLEFMEHRMNDTLAETKLQDQVYAALSNYYFTIADLVRISTYINISKALWMIDGQAIDNIVSFINEVNQKESMHLLIEAIQRDFPDALDD
jgi:hypothetical protein